MGQATGGERVLVVGVSTRAAAESAARAGFAVTSVDAFADLDHHPAVTALTPSGGFGPRAVVRTASRIACDAIAYLSMFENHPDEVADLSAGRILWGNPPPVLRRVRDPRQLCEALSARGFAVPRLGGDAYRSWLSKPIASGGGIGIRPWRPSNRVPAGRYVQERIDGVSASVVFCAAQGRARVLGVSRQLIGSRAFGASGFRYCGSVLDARLGVDVHDQVEQLVNALTEEFGLRGVNGIDFILRDGSVYPIEVNPRWSSSMELVERSHGVSIFGVHAAACRDGVLADIEPIRAPGSTVTSGKGIVFARQDVIIGDTRPWLTDLTVRDVPREGDRIQAGRPVCTVFAEGRDAKECEAALERRAADMYQILLNWEVALV